MIIRPLLAGPDYLAFTQFLKYDGFTPPYLFY